MRRCAPVEPPIGAERRRDRTRGAPRARTDVRLGRPRKRSPTSFRRRPNAWCAKRSSASRAISNKIIGCPLRRRTCSHARSRAPASSREAGARRPRSEWMPSLGGRATSTDSIATRPRDDVYSIDTPPPTVSGSLHVGHVFSYHPHRSRSRAFSACAARPCSIRWDGTTTACRPNGACRTTTAFAAIRRCRTIRRSRRRPTPPKQPISISRPNFIELCNRLTAEDEKAFEHLWKYLGLSVDWSMTYATIGRRAQRVSQLAFLRLLQQRPGVSGRSADAVGRGFQDRRRAGGTRRSRAARRVSPHPLREILIGGAVEIETTRPELIPACVALVAHPDDERYQPLFGHEVTTPLFGVRVPVKAHTLADPAKGSGIAMICTFGDITDVTWWRELHLPVRAVIQPDGTLGAAAVGRARLGVRRSRARAASLRRAGSAVGRQGPRKNRRAAAESGDLVGEPRPITHAVKFYEKGDRPLEIVTSRQWFIKTDRIPRGAARARPRIAVASGLHAGALRKLDQRAERRLVRQPSAVLRRAVSGVVSDRDGRPRRVRPTDCGGRGSACRSIRRPMCRPGIRADQRGQPGGFAGDPGRDGHLGDVVAHAADRLRLARRPGAVRADVSDGSASAGARHHSHVALRHGAAGASRAQLAALDERRASPAGSSIPIARRCRSPKATS